MSTENCATDGNQNRWRRTEHVLSDYSYMSAGHIIDRGYNTIHIFKIFGDRLYEVYAFDVAHASRVYGCGITQPYFNRVTTTDFGTEKEIFERKIKEVGVSVFVSDYACHCCNLWFIEGRCARDAHHDERHAGFVRNVQRFGFTASGKTVREIGASVVISDRWCHYCGDELPGRELRDLHHDMHAQNNDKINKALYDFDNPVCSGLKRRNVAKIMEPRSGHMFLFSADKRDYCILIWEHKTVVYVLDDLCGNPPHYPHRRILDGQDRENVTLSAKCVGPSHIIGCFPVIKDEVVTMQVFNIHLGRSIYGYRGDHYQTTDRSVVLRGWDRAQCVYKEYALSILGPGDDFVQCNGSNVVGRTGYKTAFESGNVLVPTPPELYVIAAKLTGTVTEERIPALSGMDTIIIPLSHDGATVLFSTGDRIKQLGVYTKEKTTMLHGEVFEGITDVVSFSTCGENVLLHVERGYSEEAIILVPLDIDPGLEAAPFFGGSAKAPQYQICPALSWKDPELYVQACGERSRSENSGTGIVNRYQVATNGDTIVCFRGNDLVLVLAHLRGGNIRARSTPWELKMPRGTMSDAEFYHTGAENDLPLGDTIRWRKSLDAPGKLKLLSGAARMAIWTVILCTRKLPSELYNLISYFACGAIYKTASPYHVVSPTLEARLGERWIPECKRAMQRRRGQVAKKAKLEQQIGAMRQKLADFCSRLTAAEGAIGEAEAQIGIVSQAIVASQGDAATKYVFVPKPVGTFDCGKTVCGEGGVVGYTCNAVEGIVNKRCGCN